MVPTISSKSLKQVEQDTKKSPNFKSWRGQAYLKKIKTLNTKSVDANPTRDQLFYKSEIDFQFSKAIQLESKLTAKRKFP